MNEQPKCELCGEPMPEGEEMFKYHGYSGPCPKPYGSGQVAPQGDQNEAKVVTPQGTTEERFKDKFINIGSLVVPRDGTPWKFVEKEKEVVAFIESETSLSYQRGLLESPDVKAVYAYEAGREEGQDDLRERMIEKVEQHYNRFQARGTDLDKGWNDAMKYVLSLLKAKESNQTEK